MRLFREVHVLDMLSSIPIVSLRSWKLILPPDKELRP